MSTATAKSTVNPIMSIDYDRPQEALASLIGGKCTAEEYAQWQEGREAMLRAQAARQSRAAGRLTTRVSEKGGVSVYGLGRWPVTLYREQWARLFEAREAIEAFVAANLPLLRSKEAKAQEAKSAETAAAAPAEIG